MAEQNLTLERVRALLDYDPESGIFTWRIGNSNRRAAGMAAGCHASNGYVFIGIDKSIFRAHRIAWLVTYGRWPVSDIDHMDGDRSNNRLSNLREVTHAVNQQNRRGPTSHNKLGMAGVTRDHGRFFARITTGDKVTYLGRFSTAEAAHGAYLTAKRKLHPGFVE